ncbi:MAG: prephenate dehydrogenase [Bacteroidota bacterium]
MKEKYNIAIIGVGLIGGSLGLAIKNSKLKANIIGFDKSKVLEKANKIGAIDSGSTDIKEVVKNADLIILALHLKLNLRYLKIVSALAKNNSIIVDVGSVKSNISSLSKKYLKAKQIFIPAHPMAGSEKQGVENANSKLFQNTTFVICSDKNSNTDISKLLEIIKAIGANILFVSAKKHDKIVASISHLPQLISVALMNSIPNDERNISYKMAANGFKDLTRIASSKFTVWEDILKENKTEILKSISNFKNNLSQIENDLKNNNFKELQNKFKKSNKERDKLFF